MAELNGTHDPDLRSYVAAANAADDKRLRYPPSGGELVPLSFDAGGRPGAETVACARSLGYGLEPAEKTEVIRYAWQQPNPIVQIGNAETLLSASG